MLVRETLKSIFEMNVIYEGILTLYDLDKKPHMASMGYSFDEEFNLILRPFKDTKSYSYLKKEGKAVINVVNDVELFFNATYGEDKSDLFKKSYKLKIPRLKDAKLYIEGKVIEIKEDEARATFKLEPVYLYAKKTFERPFTRAEYAVIEALIHSTRIRVFSSLKLFEEVERLISMIDYYDKLIGRIAPGSKYQRIMEEINKIVEETLKNK